MTVGTRYETQVAAAVEALAIEGPDSYRWLGRRFTREAAEASSGGLARPLADTIAERLYRDFYCAGMPSHRPVPVERSRAARAPFINALSEANVGSGMWASGWTVLSTEADSVWASREGLRLLVSGDRLRYRGSGVPRAGDEIEVRYPKELLAVSPGYYVAVGNAAPSDDELGAASRVYFNVTADGAATLVNAVTSRLNAAAVPFRLKLLDDPRNFNRCDAAVLYLPRATFAAAAPSLRAVASAMRPALEDAVPALTKRLCAGIGAADDPGDRDESFGSHRCRLIAGALVLAHERGMRTFDARRTAIAAAFEEAGLDLGSPYLSSRSRDLYWL